MKKTSKYGTVANDKQAKIFNEDSIDICNLL